MVVKYLAFLKGDIRETAASQSVLISRHTRTFIPKSVPTFRKCVFCLAAHFYPKTGLHFSEMRYSGQTSRIIGIATAMTMISSGRPMRQ